MESNQGLGLVDELGADGVAGGLGGLVPARLLASHRRGGR